jgi:hypothetical protein
MAESHIIDFLSDCDAGDETPDHFADAGKEIAAVREHLDRLAPPDRAPILATDRRATTDDSPASSAVECVGVVDERPRKPCAHCGCPVVFNPETGYFHDSPINSSFNTAPYPHQAVPASDEAQRQLADRAKQINLPAPGEVYRLAAERAAQRSADGNAAAEPELYLAVHCGREMISGSPDQFCRICGAAVRGDLYQPFTSPKQGEPSTRAGQAPGAGEGEAAQRCEAPKEMEPNE